MSEAYIKTENLCYTYQGDEPGSIQVPVLKNLNITIQKGDFVAILGHNGSGKSTFAKLLNLILEATSGKIFIGGKDITSPDLNEADILETRRKVGMVFQNPDNQLVATVVEEDVAFGPENLGIPSEEIRARVDEALKTVGMTAYRRHEPHRLSGGQKQRVAIAGILAMKPECMIFDESTAMLDPIGRKEIMETVTKLNREEGITILFITHDMSEAAMADRVIVLDDGEIRLDGTPDEVFSHPDTLKSIGLAVPQCTEIVQSLSGYLGSALKNGHICTPDGCAEMLCRALGGN